jgi:SsrA-binding protein
MRVINRKAKFNYEFLERLEVGIVLTGAEVKSAKKGQIKLDDAFVRIDEKGETWLVNAHIHPYQFADNRNYNPTRSRKLLLHKKEILSLSKKMEGRNLSLVPTACYLKKGSIKLEIALARGKKRWQKKEKIKQRDIEREMAREMKNY